MTISDSFTSEHVGFVPVGIFFGSPEHFPVDPVLGNVALARKHLSPAIPVTILHPVSVEEEPGEVILNVDIHCLAAFDDGISRENVSGNAEGVWIKHRVLSSGQINSGAVLQYRLQGL